MTKKAVFTIFIRQLVEYKRCQWIDQYQLHDYEQVPDSWNKRKTTDYDLNGILDSRGIYVDQSEIIMNGMTWQSFTGILKLFECLCYLISIVVPRCDNLFPEPSV
jgi:hypothetical protein